MQLVSRMFAATLVLSVATASAIQAQDRHPNFSGVWVMDASKTEVEGQVGTPASATYAITHRGDSIIVDRETISEAGGSVSKSRTVWGVDGKPWPNVVPVNHEPITIANVLSWDGNVLVIKGEFSLHGFQVSQVDRWTMSADQKSIVIYRKLVANGEEAGSSTTTFVKKP